MSLRIEVLPYSFLALTLYLPSTLFAQQVAIIEQPLTTPGYPTTLTIGPDRALWFTSTQGIGRLSSTGALEYPNLTLGTPSGIAAAPDGALWFPEYFTNSIGRITTSGVMTSFPIGTDLASPDGIALGPDGALWFSEFYASRIGRITTVGQITTYYLPPIGFELPGPEGITSGPDGALWFTSYQSFLIPFANAIGRITTAGVFTEYTVPGLEDGIMSIASGPDGALWFTESLSAKIGRITTAGVVTEYPVPSGADPQYIAAGKDGALWFTENGPAIGRISTAGLITEYPTPTQPNGTLGIAASPNGAIYFAESANKIGEVVFPSAILAVDIFSETPGSSAVLSGSGFSPGETVNIYSNSIASRILTTSIAATDGSILATVGVPELPYGASSFEAVGQTSGKLAVAPYSIAPTLDFNPANGVPGAYVSASGFGFLPGETIYLTWGLPQSALGSATADPRGSFSGAGAITIQIPEDAYGGINAVFARGAISGARVRVRFEVE